MAKNGKTQTKVASLNYSLGGFDWVVSDKERAEFARWLIEGNRSAGWYQIYRKAFDNLPGVAVDLRNGQHTVHKPATLTRGDAYSAMKKAIAKLADKLPNRSSSEQLALIHTEAAKLGFAATHKQIKDVLESDLKFQHNPKFDTLFQASPWRNYFAVQEIIFNQFDGLKPENYYQHDSNQSEFSPYNSRMAGCRMALTTVAEHFYCRLNPIEIEGEGGETIRVTIQEKTRRARRFTFDAAQNLLKFKSGDDAKRLAKFITAFVSKDNWPRQPAGLSFNPAFHFDPEKCRAFVCQHLQLASDTKMTSGTKEWYFWTVALAIIDCDELQVALLKLADDADRRRKGDAYFRNALTKLFGKISAAFQPADKKRMESLTVLADPEIRTMRQSGDSEKQIVQAMAHRLKLEKKEGESLATYFRAARRKHGLD